MEICCSTLFDMRGNAFEYEMARRAAKRVEVLPSQANAVQVKDGMASQVRMRIIEASLAAFSALPARTPVHRKTRQQKRKRAATNPGICGACDQSKVGQTWNLSLCKVRRSWQPSKMESGAHNVLRYADSGR